MVSYMTWFESRYCISMYKQVPVPIISTVVTFLGPSIQPGASAIIALSGTWSKRVASILDLKTFWHSGFDMAFFVVVGRPILERLQLTLR